MKATMSNGVLTYVGFDPTDNGSWIIKEKDDWTYVNFQRDAFTQIISGYVVRQPDGRYRAFDLMETYSEFFDDKLKAIALVKQKYQQEG